MTGGNPRSTGIYYDVSYNRSLLPPGTTSCAGVAPGTAVAYDESIDKDKTRLDAGQGLAGLPGSILSMTAQPRDVINPAALPVDPATCTPVLPHQYLKVNTLFDVAHQAGLRTAWSDKHAGVRDPRRPLRARRRRPLHPGDQLRRARPAATGPRTTPSTQQYDGYKVQAVLNEIDGYDHSRTTKVGIPADLRHELPVRLDRAEAADLRRPGRRLPARWHRPRAGPAVGALDFVDTSVGSMVSRAAQGPAGLAARRSSCRPSTASRPPTRRR